MSDFKVGDRVRLVHEGVVTRAGDGTLEIDGTYRILGQGETVEVLERKVEPFRVGTVAGRGSSTFAIRLEDGWRWSHGAPIFDGTDEMVRRFIKNEPNFNVLYEPPA